MSLSSLLRQFVFAAEEEEPLSEGPAAGLRFSLVGFGVFVGCLVGCFVGSFVGSFDGWFVGPGVLVLVVLATDTDALPVNNSHASLWYCFSSSPVFFGTE